MIPMNNIQQFAVGQMVQVWISTGCNGCRVEKTLEVTRVSKPSQWGVQTITLSDGSKWNETGRQKVLTSSMTLRWISQAK